MIFSKLKKGALLLLLSLLATGCTFKGATPPLLISKRESMIGQGVVFVVTNTSDTPLHGVAVTVTDPDGKSHSLYKQTVDAHDSFDVGWLELKEWNPPINSKLHVSVDGYPASLDF